ncbi:MAG: hypothetical protein HQL24_04720 [Candidatus Omnitrophica bacterium]|nr:hypothetical protein [Candidatus Omnitrophota bacterium]
MMKSKAIRSLILSILILPFAYPQISSAQINALPQLPMGENSPTEEASENSSDRFLIEAYQYSSGGKTLEAMVSVGKTILSNPLNPKIPDFLDEFSKTPSLTSQQQIGILHIEDLISYLGNLNQKINYFKAKKDELQEQLIKNGYDGYALTEELSKERATVWQKSFTPKAHWSQEDLKTHDPMDATIEILSAKSEELKVEILALQEEFNRLKQLNANYASLIIEKDSTNSELISRNNELYKRQLSLIMQKLNDFQSEVQHRNKRIEQLTRQLVDSVLKLSEKDLALEKQSEQIALLNDHLTELESRFELRDRILNEKDAAFTSLKADFEDLKLQAIKERKEIIALVSSKEKKLAELSGILKLYKGKLGQSSQNAHKQSYDILSLQRQLALVKKQLFEKNRILQKTQQAFQDLERKLLEVDGKFKDQGNESDNSSKKTRDSQSEFHS